ncbi:hypothetical protein P0D91_04785 [Pseudomonas sp. CBSPBW29]|uniref:hypothetical protein n=1 Tax=Pseudomonas sp. CBS TaxID=2971912 RepID=UPI0021AC1ACB|nr:hypothetical protein [Pseudomonas sp. CBS]WEL43628.1 hypothetical protein P0D91_04785 [Pseudomonas sp. CBSPBW29]WEL68161.1 hypothetical protein P0D94_18240 [Pseudomonas sp. CBSPCGW29]WEL80574.1 hypothetical protein P0D95_21510 [Pseudomonas sp. CBSPCAW29]WEL89089.1 hypothetical protein P0D90_03790 [Pseudomonas sp. CBSPCBW29]UVH51743.1 hypothetical protein NVB75_02355 [Pseudomonas sp. CBS]
MSLPTQNGKPGLAFIKFSQDLSRQASKASVTVQRFEEAFKEVSSGILNLSPTIETDKVVKHALMERMLYRDMHVLLTAILRLKKGLATSIRLLIQNGDAQLATNHHTMIDNSQDSRDLSNARSDIIESLDLLESLESRLRLIDR